MLDGAFVELREAGLANFSVGRVARRAKVHETTIYRRWPKREDLIIAVCMHFADVELPVPDTGSLRGDLQIVVKNLAALVQSPIGEVLFTVAFSARSVSEFRELAVRFWQARIEIGQQVFAHAIERGEWLAGYDKSEVFTELIGPMLAKYFLLQEKLDEAFLQQRVARLLTLGTQPS
ncbi:MAG: TetR/AcrR family transcriptional regulator [Haliangiales bacterium]